MTAGDVVCVLQLLDEHGIEVWVDGGWGVDALLGAQTRPHADLDIAINHADVPKVRELLEARGFRDVPRDDTRDVNFVLGDAGGREVDVHSFIFDADGKHVYGVEYPAESLSGHGWIDGRPVRCIAAEWMVKFHTGYSLDVNDYRDVRALCERFGLDLPAEYERFAQDDAARPPRVT